jgi:hypothetical protein
MIDWGFWAVKQEKGESSLEILETLYSSGMFTRKSMAFGAALAFIAGISFANSPATNTVEYTFCVNSKTKVVTYSKSGKCQKGNEAIQVGAIGPQGPQGVPGDIGPSGPTGPTGPQGEPAKTSFNLLLRDGSGNLVENLVGDGSVYRDGRYWTLDYETGKFSPAFDYLYVSFFDSECKKDPVILVNTYTQTSADRELERLRFQSKVYPFILWAGEKRFDQDYYSIPADAKLIDNRNAATGSEWYEWTSKKTIYTLNSQLDRCELATFPFFYIEGLTKVDIKIPDALPAPIRWGRS